MKRLVLALAVLFAGCLLPTSRAPAPLVTPPTWVYGDGYSGTASLNQVINYGNAANWNASDNSDGNDWNAWNYQGIYLVCVQTTRPSNGSWHDVSCNSYGQGGACMSGCGASSNITFNEYGTWQIRVQAMDWRPWYSWTNTSTVTVPAPQYSMTVNVTGTGCSYAGGNGNFNSGQYSYPSVSVTGGYQVLGWSMTPFGVINCSNTAYNCDGSAGAGYPGHTTVSVWMDSNKTVTANCGSSCTPVAVPTTGFTVAGTDLKNRFSARCSQTSPAAATGFTVNGTDINQYFEPGSGGAGTGFTVNGTDLNSIFKP